MTVTAITPTQLTTMKAKFLPTGQTDWDDAAITDRWTGGYPSTVRQYWYERTQDTAKYLDLSDSGGSLPITQIHRQAKEMLDYWDAYIVKYGDSVNLARGVSFGKIRRRYHNPCPMPVRVGPSPYSPYKQLD